MKLFVRLPEGQTGIIERKNQYYKTIFPGELHFLVPSLDKLFTFNQSPITMEITPLTVLVEGSFTLDLNIFTKYKILEPYKAMYDTENKDVGFTIRRFISKTLSTKVMDYSYNQVVEEKEKIEEHLKNQLRKKSRQWGFKLIHCQIKSIKKSFISEQEKESLYQDLQEEIKLQQAEVQKEEPEVVKDDLSLEEHEKEALEEERNALYQPKPDPHKMPPPKEEDSNDSPE